MFCLVHTHSDHLTDISHNAWRMYSRCVMSAVSPVPPARLHSEPFLPQVKWNRRSSQTLASSHEGDIRVWDRRKLSIPERYISAHTAKIHGLDWSPSVVSETAAVGTRAIVAGTGPTAVGIGHLGPLSSLLGPRWSGWDPCGRLWNPLRSALGSALGHWGCLTFFDMILLCVAFGDHDDGFDFDFGFEV